MPLRVTRSHSAGSGPAAGRPTTAAVRATRGATKAARRSRVTGASGFREGWRTHVIVSGSTFGQPVPNRIAVDGPPPLWHGARPKFRSRSDRSGAPVMDRDPTAAAPPRSPLGWLPWYWSNVLFPASREREPDSG